MNFESFQNKKSKKILILFSIEVFLIAFLLVFSIVNYHKILDNEADINEIQEYITNHGYEIKNIDTELDSNIINYLFATNSELNTGIHYIVVQNSASNFYHHIEKKLESYANGTFFKKWVSIFDYRYYAIETNLQYYVLAKKGNTILSIMGSSQNKNKINEIISDLKFNCPKNIYSIFEFIGIFILILIVTILWKIFVKAGRKGWLALIPFYNCYCLVKLIFNKGWYILFLIIPFVNFIFILMLSYQLARKFGKSNCFAIFSMLFPYITMQIIAFDDSIYRE